MKKSITIRILLLCSAWRILGGSINCIGANLSTHALLEGEEIDELITRAPEMVFSQTNDVRVYREQVCRKISELPDAQMRCRQFRKLMESACSVDFARMENALQHNQNQDSWIRERQKANWRLGAYYRLEGLAEDIWVNLFMLEKVPPPGDQIFQPWFILLEKLKTEEKKEGKKSLKMFERNANQVERLYLFFYLTDQRKQPDVQDRAAVEARFKQVVGRPIRSAEQYKADARRRTKANIREHRKHEEENRRAIEYQKRFNKEHNINVEGS